MNDAAIKYPQMLEIRPIAGGSLATTVAVPGSKSITNRALVLAALNAHRYTSVLHGVLRSEDTEIMAKSLWELGFRFELNWPEASIHFQEDPEGISLKPANLYVLNSGTSMRFLTALSSLGDVPIRLDGVARMRERPIGDLLDALQQLGIDARSENNNGCPPVVIRGRGPRRWPNNHVKIRGDISSQFLSGLLMTAPLGSRDEIDIELDGPLISIPYVEMTLQMMEHFGMPMLSTGTAFIAKPISKDRIAPKEYTVEPDATAASYFFAAAAILGGRVTIPDLPENSLQGDVQFVHVLERMGCRIEKCSAGLTIHGKTLQGCDVDMNDISDTVMTLGAVACFANGPTTIRNVAHIRHKETDRIAALTTELRKVGAEVDEFEDGLKITPKPLHGAAIDTYHDHRMAMSMALIGLKVPGVIIRNPGCVAKTYPGFWNDFEKLRLARKQ